jgi:hypothetical protein
MVGAYTKEKKGVCSNAKMQRATHEAPCSFGYFFSNQQTSTAFTSIIIAKQSFSYRCFDLAREIKY